MPFEKEKKLSEVLSGMVNSNKWKTKLHQTKIREVWKEKMGATIHQYTKDISLRKNKLFITIESATLRQELTYEREKIKNMMNLELGGEHIESVIIR